MILSPKRHGTELIKNTIKNTKTRIIDTKISKQTFFICQALTSLKDSVRVHSMRSTHFSQYNIVLHESHVHRAEFQKKWATRIMEYSFSTCLLMLLDCVYLSALQKYICHPQHIHFSVLKLCQHSTAAYKTVHLWEYTL